MEDCLNLSPEHKPGRERGDIITEHIFQIRLDQSEGSNHHPDRKYKPFNC